MNTFIENNRPWLKFYCTTARIVGWVILILAAVIAAIGILSGNFLFGNLPQSRLIYIQPLIFTGVLPGILILGIAQFIRYLFESRYKPGFLLRHGDKILYLYAFLLIAGVVWNHLIISMMQIGINFTKIIPVMLASLVLTVPKVLILIGLAQVVKRILPVIEESKTLV
ncbi:MAG: hypothetical protein FVQ85_07475 [Planctomycetes bacterium]|nr:hypothetical protein [Planctomycetota bacterium]